MMVVCSRFSSRWLFVLLLGVASSGVGCPIAGAASSDRKAAGAAVSTVGGTWIGRYRCAQGWTGLELTIAELGEDRIEAEFSFFPLPENPRVPSGRFLMSGSFDARAGRLNLSPGQWLERPPGYRGVGLEGRLDPTAGTLAGRVSSGCRDFELARKGEPAVPPAAPPAPGSAGEAAADAEITDPRQAVRELAADTTARVRERGRARVEDASRRERAAADVVDREVEPDPPSAALASSTCPVDGAAAPGGPADFDREFEEIEALFESMQFDRAWIRTADLICSGRFPISDKVGAFDRASAPFLTESDRGRVAVAPEQLRHRLERASLPSLSDGEELAIFLFAILALGHDGSDSCTGARLLFLPALSGHPQSQLMLGQVLARGSVCGWPAAAAEAAGWYEKAAAAGLPHAMARLGIAHMLGEGVRQDIARAQQLFSQVAASDDAGAQFLVATFYASDQSRPAQPDQAARWFRAAAESGHAAAQVIVGDMTWQQATELFMNSTAADQQANRRVQEIYGEAIAWFRKAAEQGYAEGQYRLARAHYDYRRYDEALEWYEAAAAQGHADAQFALGSWYWQGGAQRNPAAADDELAVRWFRAAAERGHARAQTSLGWAYVEGRGVPQDDAEGVAWFRKAAEANESQAEDALAWAYERGRGVPKDLAQASAWNRRAARHGSEGAASRTLEGQLKRLAIQTVGGADVLHAILGLRDEDVAGIGTEQPRCDTTVGFSCNAGVDLLGAQIYMSIK